MPRIELTDDQIIELVRQLSPPRQETVFKRLLTQQWGVWDRLSRYGVARARQTATQRGRDWDAMAEDEREAFIDELIHEDRRCAG